jgi:hypothetical protein
MLSPVPTHFLLPEVLILESPAFTQDFNGNPSKDNFHNPIL